ncbi:uracil-DNA glycosylase [Azohydromonas australica]|uniref:uracil-DNA glycosylase n=1 Tax=Azohydromonas australica TaxID=364039 RepID=UPI0003F4C85B|nr:uracil-DNA glycosylase [Azohydromonas australica]
MAYSERQQQMLAWMGIRVWQPPAEAGTPDEAPGVVAEPQPAMAPAARAETPPPQQPVSRAPEPSAARAPAWSAPAPRPPVTAAAGVALQSAGRPLPPAAGAGSASAASAPATALRVDGPIDVAPGLSFGGGEVASMDWPALRAAVEHCRACALCESRKNTVFGVGNERADWMIVGEAPGEQEDLRGEPFVGPAGQLLDAMLQSLGLTREEAPPQRQVFIANTLKCRPPRNRNPAPEELAQCEPYLQRQLALVQPRVILAMGRFAVQSLLRSTLPIGKLRGQVHSYQGTPLVVTYHPAYLLRNPVDKARAWDDLCLAASVMERQGGR